MVVFPLWLLKYFLVITGISFIYDGQFVAGIVFIVIGLIWIIYNWSNHKK